MNYNIYYVDGPAKTLVASFTTEADAVAYLNGVYDDVSYIIVLE